MSMEDLLGKPLTPWMNGQGQDTDIVLASRVRLARNLEGIPFPHRANKEQLAEVVTKLNQVIPDFNIGDNDEYMFVNLNKLPLLERIMLVEKHIISPKHAREPENRAIIIRNDSCISIMVNEEDHLRIQCLMAGFDLVRALEKANKIDDIIENRYNIAFNEQIGYLTACPTNVGTGLRASVMVHLPALVLTKQISRIIEAVTQLGLAVRGLYGEGTEAAGNIFQISNQLTLGYTEQEIIDNLDSVVRQVINHERTARGGLLAEAKDITADRVWRSYGLLKYACSISGQEALSLLSEVRLGIDLEIITNVSPNIFNELLVITGHSFLQKLAKYELNSIERKKLRAKIIREKLSQEV